MPHRSTSLRIGGIVSLVLLGSVLSLGPVPDPLPVFRLATSEPGVYRVSYEALVQAGLPSQPVPSASLSLSNRDKLVPIWVEDGHDGSFGPGDVFEFVAQRVAGANRYFHEHAHHNIYWLGWNSSPASRMVGVPAPSSGVLANRQAASSQLSRSQHLEHDQLLIRLAGHEIHGEEQPELWFWAKLTHIDPKPFSVLLNVPDIDPRAAELVQLKIHFRALSHRARCPKPRERSRRWRRRAAKRLRKRPRPVCQEPTGHDHRVELALNGVPVGVAEWSGKTPYLLELPPLAANVFQTGPNTLTLRVPARTPPSQKNPIVDVVMLDWVEIDYPHRGVVTREQAQLKLHATSRRPLVRLTVPGTTHLLAYGPSGSRIEAEHNPQAEQAEQVEFDRLHRFFTAADGGGIYHLVRNTQFKVPDQIERDQPSSLRSIAQAADYLMITHRRLHEAILPLAAFHRRRGLRVAVIDIQDIYDEFNHGVVHPRAIRDYIAYAYHHWAKAPRFVLLVGDASWDIKNTTVDDANYANWTRQQLLNDSRFGVKQSTVYPQDARPSWRALIPTWNYHSAHGHSAADNWFVSVDGDDAFPDLAIGRLPVADPTDVRAIVDKTIRYASQSQVGPWRRNIVWITSEQQRLQRQTEQAAELPAKRGFEAIKIYPQPEEADNARHQARLHRAFNQGQLLVHFLGHGGRYIWRTGPPSSPKRHDLFTLDDLDRLAPNDRLPVILSMTCFSAPFDHPNADSIGEKFLRLPDRGAVAILAASWRLNPTLDFSQALIRELTQPGTVGEAIMRAKRAIRDRTQIELYNLLGDPAVPIAAPQLSVQLTPVLSHHSDLPGLQVMAEIEARAFQGRAIIDWLAANGAVVASQEQAIDDSHFTAVYSGEATRLAEIQAVRVYVWDVEAGLDGLGWQDLNLD